LSLPDIEIEIEEVVNEEEKLVIAYVPYGNHTISG
jgi:hypothetical protein